MCCWRSTLCGKIKIFVWEAQTVVTQKINFLVLYETCQIKIHISARGNVETIHRKCKTFKERRKEMIGIVSQAIKIVPKTINRGCVIFLYAMCNMKCTINPFNESKTCSAWWSPLYATFWNRDIAFQMSIVVSAIFLVTHQIFWWSPDLNPWDFCFWVCFKDLIDRDPIRSLSHLKGSIAHHVR